MHQRLISQKVKASCAPPAMSASVVLWVNYWWTKEGCYSKKGHGRKPPNVIRLLWKHFSPAIDLTTGMNCLLWSCSMPRILFPKPWPDGRTACGSGTNRMGGRKSWNPYYRPADLCLRSNRCCVADIRESPQSCLVFKASERGLSSAFGQHWSCGHLPGTRLTKKPPLSLQSKVKACCCGKLCKKPRLNGKLICLRKYCNGRDSFKGL